MNKKLGLFPVTREQCALIRYKLLLKEYNLSMAFVPKFLLLDGQDVSCLDGGTDVDFYLTDYNKDKLSTCDVIYLDYSQHLQEIQIYKDVIADAQTMGIEIIYSDTLANMFGIQKTELLDIKNYEDNQLYDLTCPVITILSQGEGTDQLATELALAKHFLSKGLNVLSIGSSNICGFFGFQYLLNLLNTQDTYYTSVIKLNHHVKELADAQMADLVIISSPHAIMRYNNQILLGLGVMPSILGNAIQSDLTVLCMYYAKYTEDYLDGMSNYCNFKFGCPVDVFSISNTYVEPDQTTNMRTLSHFDLDSNFVKSSLEYEIKSAEHNLFNPLDDISIDNLCSKVELILTGNVKNMK